MHLETSSIRKRWIYAAVEHHMEIYKLTLSVLQHCIVQCPMASLLLGSRTLRWRGKVECSCLRRLAGMGPDQTRLWCRLWSWPECLLCSELWEVGVLQNHYRSKGDVLLPKGRAVGCWLPCALAGTTPRLRARTPHLHRKRDWDSWQSFYMGLSH